MQGIILFGTVFSKIDVKLKTKVITVASHKEKCRQSYEPIGTLSKEAWESAVFIILVLTEKVPQFFSNESQSIVMQNQLRIYFCCSNENRFFGLINLGF